MYHARVGKLFVELDEVELSPRAPAGPAAAVGPPAVVPGPADRVVGVAVNANVWQDFDYLWPEAFGEPFVGQRVRVPFGHSRRPVLGFVTDAARRGGDYPLKPVAAAVDADCQLDETLWRLGAWIAHYYLTPAGMVLAAMVPSAVGTRPPKREAVAVLASERHDWPGSLGARQKRILDELLEARRQGIAELTVEHLRHHADAPMESVRRLQQRGLIRLDARPVRLPELSGVSEGDPFELNDDQRAVMDALSPKLDAGGFSVTLLHGVTGSGKTEVYVRALRRVVAAGRQGLLLVPEIALATQTLQRLLKRLPAVAVLHSGLTDAERAFYYDQIRQGHAAAIVGPRSAVFAPARRLGLIVVDEEHEGSYKQDNAPRYHARDVAIKRAQLAGVPVLLGSATPSLESMYNAATGRYGLLKLPRRVRGLPMPKLQIVHLRKEMESHSGRIELIGVTLTHRIAAALDRSEQVILLMNRRGYASFVFCPSCRWTFDCQNCSRPLVFHQATQLCLCHYCQETHALPDKCPACAGKLLLFGLGIQRIEGELSRKFPTARVARMDSDTMTSPAQFRKVFDGFAAGSLDILLGTQMVAKGLDFPRVSLVGVISADTALAIPDFRASERTFQLVVQVAGRAGRADLPGEVIVQTLHGDEPSIQYAAQHDYASFAAWELPLRKDAHMPPYWRIVRFIIRHSKADRAQQGAEALAAALRPLLPKRDVIVWGPQPAGVKRIRGQFRFQLLLFTRKAGLVQQAVAARLGDILHDIKAEVLADVDPVNLI